MDAGKRTINDIFTGSKMLEIPFFQRSYVWKESEWERMLEDIENVCVTKEPYFMGSVILKQQLTQSNSTVGDVRTVIDGQQRLTTLSILLKVLCLKTNALRKFDKRFRLDDDRPVLQHSFNDVASYNRIMDLQKIEELPYKDTITSAYTYFAENLDPFKVDFDVICSKIMFVGIDLNYDENEQQIFDTINSLGVRLTTAELLKNYFFSRDDLDLYKTHWQDVFERDEDTRSYWGQEIVTGRIKRTFIDLFFYSLLQILVQDSKYAVRAEDKSAFSRVESLFPSYKKFVGSYLNGDKNSLLKEMVKYADVFRNKIDGSVVDKELPKKAGIERINVLIFALDTTTLIPYILFIEQNVQDEQQKNDLYGYLESYIMRRLVTRQTTKNYNQLFTERLIANRIMTKSDFIVYLAKQTDKINYMPTNSEVTAAFHTSVLTNKYAAGTIYLLESKIRNEQMSSTQLLGIRKYSLEHMMPKKWRNHWKFNGTDEQATERDRVLLTLGNLAIITQSLNASIRDSEWSVKLAGKGTKEGLKKYANGIETISKYLDYTEWNESCIKERADELANKAIEVWSCQ